jgi:uncharacterized protein (DUF983 family)
MSAKPKATGFQVVCPYCGDVEAAIRLDVNNVHALTCSSCDEEFSPQQARDKAAAVLARWEAVVRWVELAGEMGAK